MRPVGDGRDQPRCRTRRSGRPLADANAAPSSSTANRAHRHRTVRRPRRVLDDCTGAPASTPTSAGECSKIAASSSGSFPASRSDGASSRTRSASKLVSSRTTSLGRSSLVNTAERAGTPREAMRAPRRAAAELTSALSVNRRTTISSRRNAFASAARSPATRRDARPAAAGRASAPSAARSPPRHLL